MIRSHLVLATLAGLLVIGCGGAQGGQFDSYSTALQQTRAAVDAHRASAETAKDQASCTAERTRYGGAVRPPLSDMAKMSGAGMMQEGTFPSGMMLGSSCPRCQDARLAEGCTQMQLELNTHLETPCSADPAANAAEVIRHCDRMDALLDANQQRLHQMGG